MKGNLNVQIDENRTPLQMVEQLKKTLKPDRLRRSYRKRAWRMIRELEAVKVFRPGGGIPSLWLEADLFCSLAQFLRFRDIEGVQWRKKIRQQEQPRHAPMPSRRTLVREERLRRRNAGKIIRRNRSGWATGLPESCIVVND